MHNSENYSEYLEYLNLLKILTLDCTTHLLEFIGLNNINLEKHKKIMFFLRDEYLKSIVSYKNINTMNEAVFSKLSEHEAKPYKWWLNNKVIENDNENQLWIYKFRNIGFIYPEVDSSFFIQNPLNWESNRFFKLIEITYKYMTSPCDLLNNKINSTIYYISNNYEKLSDWDTKILDSEKNEYGNIEIFFFLAEYYGDCHFFITYWKEVESIFLDGEIIDILDWLYLGIKEENMMDKVNWPSLILNNYARTKSLLKS